MATKKGFTAIVQILLSPSPSTIAHPVNPTANNNEAIKEASANGHAEIVKLLLAAGADPT
ncbi:hypothetical protein HDU76_011929, partial [Blyttiomyces sp. JEL0837]